ncbi:MAG: hypothetical protein LBV13_02255 [Methanomassiliicoccaceae archaeon]|jgi:hypothetical protein|nr:hypothetical protein [Methanomassiliicoccaceae archaeon]
MGDANSSIASKGKELLGGLIRRVKGEKPDTDDTASRTGISLRNRFSAIEPVAAPTDAVPQKKSERISDPDAGRDVKVIHTSAARASETRFSSRMGLPVPDTDDTFERRISFDDEPDGEEEDTPTVYEVPAVIQYEQSFDLREEGPPEEKGYVPDARAFQDETARRAPVPFEVMPTVREPAAEMMETRKAEVPKEPAKTRPAENVRRETTAEKAEVKRTEAPKEPAKTRPAEKEVRASDDYDGYDFLPKRCVSERISAMIVKAVQKEPKAPPKAATVQETAVKQEAVKQEPPVEKKSTLLAEKLRSRQPQQAPLKKPAEVQLDGPTQHEDMSRSSLLSKVRSDRTTSKKVSEVIRNSEQRGLKEDVMTHQTTIEECEAEISVSEVRIAAASVISQVPDSGHEDIIKDDAVLQAEIEVCRSTAVCGDIAETRELHDETVRRMTEIHEEAAEIISETAEIVPAIAEVTYEIPAEAEDVKAVEVIEVNITEAEDLRDAEIVDAGITDDNVPDATAEAIEIIEVNITEAEDLRDADVIEIETAVMESAPMPAEAEDIGAAEVIELDLTEAEDLMDADVIGIEAAVTDSVPEMTAEIIPEGSAIPEATIEVAPEAAEIAFEMSGFSADAEEPEIGITVIEDTPAEIIQEVSAIPEAAIEAPLEEEITFEMSGFSGDAAEEIWAAEDMFTIDPLKEIENDAPMQEAVCDHIHIDEMEESLLAMMDCVLVDDEIVRVSDVSVQEGTVPDAPAIEMPAVAETAIEMPAAQEAVRMPEVAVTHAKAHAACADALSIHFSFPSEETLSPSAGVSFIWGG